MTSPTVLALTPGANIVIAQMGNNGNSGATNGSDADYYSVTIGPGTSLTSTELLGLSGLGLLLASRRRKS